MDAAIVKYYEQSSRITIQTTTGFVPVQTRDIIFVESEKRHSVVHTLYGIYHCIQPFAFGKISSLNRTFMSHTEVCL